MSLVYCRVQHAAHTRLKVLFCSMCVLSVSHKKLGFFHFFPCSRISFSLSLFLSLSLSLSLLFFPPPPCRPPPPPLPPPRFILLLPSCPHTHCFLQARLARLWPAWLDAVCRFGQAQLLRRHVANELKFTAQVREISATRNRKLMEEILVNCVFRLLVGAEWEHFFTFLCTDLTRAQVL